MELFKLPCGRCIGCRIRRSREWALRCVHEAALHDENCFITLTYDDEHLPADASINKRHLQLFWKKLRKHYPPFRYFACGEYGEERLRPHYHALLFGLDFSDARTHKEVKNGHDYYRSPILDLIWGKGDCEITDLNYTTAQYVTKYVMKKIFGDQAKDHYTRVDDITGEEFTVQPEQSWMSRRPGIGAKWFDRFGGDCFPEDSVTHLGKKFPVPKYYDERLQPKTLELIKQRRTQKARENKHEYTPERLETKKRINEIRLKRNRRGVQ